MIAVVVLGVVVLVIAAAWFERLDRRRGRVHHANSVLLEQRRNSCAAGYLGEPIAGSLSHDPDRPRSGRAKY